MIDHLICGFDDECREAKIRVRALERQFQASDDPLDRTVWTSGLRSLHSLSNSKKAAATVQMIAAESGDPKRLWRALDADVADLVRKSRFGWFGHLVRKDEGDWVSA